MKITNPTLTPCYGRDYKSKAEVLADINANKDFIVAGFGGGVACSPLVDFAGQFATVRYKRLTMAVRVKLSTPAVFA